jgi:hypothetical protein
MGSVITAISAPGLVRKDIRITRRMRSSLLIMTRRNQSND